MVNITHKTNSLRQAIASAVVRVSKQETIDAIVNKKVPKGDLFEFARAAGLLAVKKTSDTIPDCHPIPIEYTAISYQIDGLNIQILVEVHTIYKTGVEVEAMHGASITALTMYDMLKPIDKGVEISNIRLVSKKGGKTDFRQETISNLRCAVIVCSDGISAGTNQDVSGQLIVEKLKNYHIEAEHIEIIPDDFTRIQEKVKELHAAGIQLLMLTGGTGLSPKDVTPEAISPLLDKQIPGIMETARNYGQQRTPYAMLSRGVAGFIDHMLVITLPGSPNGVKESMDALFPYVLHVFKVAEGYKHDQTETGQS
jgi:molybdenum cofactor biosynthesis protein MoaC